MAVGQTNGEFLLLLTSDLSVTRQKRDRSKTLQVVRYVGGDKGEKREGREGGEIF